MWPTSPFSLPFRDVIEAPEETETSDKPFTPAFAQLPVLADEWRMEFDAELAEVVVNIPRLSLDGASGSPVAAPSTTTCAEVFQAASDTLCLARALFHLDGTSVFTHPEIPSTSMLHYYCPTRNKSASNRAGSIKDRFGILFFKDAPYIGCSTEMSGLQDTKHHCHELEGCGVYVFSFSRGIAHKDGVEC